MPTDENNAPTGVPLKYRVALAVIVFATVFADQGTKEWALRTLTPGEFVPLLGAHVGWQLLFNSGGAFGLPAPAWVFLIVAIIVTVLVWRVLAQAPSPLAVTGFALLLGGAYGNIVDRLFRASDGFASGAVVDFVAWGSFPRFNVADAAITVGVALVFLSLLVVRQSNEPVVKPSDHLDDMP